MQGKLQRPVSLDKNGLLIVEEAISEEINMDSSYVFISDPSLLCANALSLLLPNMREGSNIKVVDIFNPEHSLWQKEVWRRSHTFPIPFYEKRRKRIKNQAIKAAGSLVIQKIRMP
jgi:hypothetical protein